MYEELIERLYAHCNTDQSDAITNEAADALVALQSENGSKDKEIERLRAKAKQWRQTAEENFASCEKLQAALSRVEAERDAAQKCIYDVETYLELGSGAYIVKTIQAWKNGAQGEG